MRQYPIWNDIDANSGKKSSSNFGARDGFTQYVYVGTSSQNSHSFAKIEVERHVYEDGRVTFALYVDSEIVKRGTLDGREFSIGFEGTNQAD